MAFLSLEPPQVALSRNSAQLRRDRLRPPSGGRPHSSRKAHGSLQSGFVWPGVGEPASINGLRVVPADVTRITRRLAERFVIPSSHPFTSALAAMLSARQER